MKAELIDYMGTDLSAVNAARVSMNKESDWEWIPDPEEPECAEIKVLSDKDRKLIHYLAKNKHFSCFEHQAVSLRLKVPLFIARQIQRHRTFSYNEISRRYVKDDLEFYWPEKWRKAAENVKQGSSEEEAPDGSEAWHFRLGRTIEDVVDMYRWAVENEVCAEQARMILPQNLYTEFYMTGNLRNWSHFLNLRLGEHAQKEVRDIAQQCLDIIKPLFPVSLEALMEYGE